MNAEESSPSVHRQPVLAFVASLFVFGLGLLYVGRLRLAIATLAGTYGIIAFFSWTRLIVSTPYGVSIATVVMLLCILATATSGAVIATRAPVLPTKSYNRWWAYLLWTVGVFALSTAAYFTRERAFGYGTYDVPSVSMSPTIEKGDDFIADTWRYSRHPPAVGDVVLLELADGPGVRYLKRIVGLPGDHIEIRDRVLYRNGLAVVEPYIRTIDQNYDYGWSFGPVDVESGKVFVLGDNRGNSKDSRIWGSIPISQLRGRAQFIWFSRASDDGFFSRAGKRLFTEE